MTRKRSPEELTLIEMLNAFDLIANKNGGSAMSSTSLPGENPLSSTSSNDISS